MEKKCKVGSCADCFDKSPLFKLMSPEELQQIEETRSEVVFKPNEIIYKQGTNATQIVTITQKQVIGKIAGVLIYLNQNIYSTNPMNLTITYQDIAEMTGMTKDTVVRVLKDLSNDKVIEIDNTFIKILDFEKLNLFNEIG
jgi:CRP-like cAMP-binding protein